MTITHQSSHSKLHSKTSLTINYASFQFHCMQKMIKMANVKYDSKVSN
jgi:hypothetical protein